MESVEILKVTKSNPNAGKYISYHLALENSLGCHQQPLVSNCFIINSSLVYLNDSKLIMHNILQQTKKFLYKLQAGEVVTALSCNQSLEFYLVMGITSQTSSYVMLYEGRDGSTLKHFLPPKHHVVDLYFFSNSEFVALVRGPTQSYILIKKFFRGENLSFSQHKTAVKKIVDSDVTRISNECHGMLQLLGKNRIIKCAYEYQHIVLQATNIPNLVGSIAYPNQYNMVLTSTSVLVYHHQQLKQEFNLKVIVGKEVELSCILKLTKRFLVAHKNSVSISVFSFDGMKVKYNRTFKSKEDINGGVISMHGSFEEMNVGLSVFVSQKYGAQFVYQQGKPLAEGVYLQHFVFGLTNMSMEKATNPYNRLFKNELEYEQISEIEGSMVPECYVLTKKTLTVYNYAQNFKVQQKFHLTEHPLNVCVHPLSFMLVCIFKDGFKIYSRLESELLELKKEFKLSTCASFSSRGILAICYLNKGRFEIALYDVTRFQVYKTFQCFYSKCPVTKINWIREDTQLEIHTSHNELVIIDIYNDAIQVEYLQKRHQKLVCYDWINQLLVTVDNDNNMSVFKKAPDSSSLSICVLQLQFLQDSIQSIHIDKITGLIILGMSNGSIKWAEWPWLDQDLNPQQVFNSFGQLSISNHPVNRLFMTVNSKYLLAVCQNKVNVLRLKKRKNGKLLNYEIDIEFSNFQNIKLCTVDSVQALDEKIKRAQEKQAFYRNELDELSGVWENRERQELQRIDTENINVQQVEQSVLTNTIDLNKKRRLETEVNFSKLYQTKRRTDTMTKDRQDKQMLHIYAQIDSLEKYKVYIDQKTQSEYHEACEFYEQIISDIKEDFEERAMNTRLGLDVLKQKMDQFKLVQKIDASESHNEREDLRRYERELVNNQYLKINSLITETQGRISHLRRENERYVTRAEFLESKKRHLEMQFQFQQDQFKQLQVIRNELESNFGKIEKTTHAYQESLNKLHTRNSHLFNFRTVYMHLQNNLHEQTKKLEQYSSQMSVNIRKMNDQLFSILDNTRGLGSREAELANNIETKKQLLNKHQKPKIVINCLSNDIRQQISLILADPCKEKVASVYKKLVKSTQHVNQLAHESLASVMAPQSSLKSKQLQRSKMIKTHLTQKKDCYENFIENFKRQHKDLDTGLSTAYNKIQTTNSKLIAECNGIKEQLKKKSKTLNELFATLRKIDCVNKDITADPHHFYENQSSRQGKTNKDKDLAEWFPEEQRRKMVKTSQSQSRTRRVVLCRQSQDEPLTRSTSKLLTVRRVKTANQNQHRHSQNIQPVDKEEVQSTVPSKPPTGHGFRKQRFNWKSSSKRTENCSLTGFSIFN